MITETRNHASFLCRNLLPHNPEEEPYHARRSKSRNEEVNNLWLNNSNGSVIGL